MTLVLSLFPGIDMLGHAFKLEGFCVVQGSDPIFGGDVRQDHYPVGKFDGLIGGPPCQSFSSLVHLVRANGHEPRFGNLIPEFERCVSEAQPAWFLMENVRAAPEPVVPGYGVKAFLLDNAMLDSGDGHGQEQTRLRRFTFGMRGKSNSDVPDLRRWIDLATFLLPDAAPACFGDGRPTRQEARATIREADEQLAEISAELGVPVNSGRVRTQSVVASTEAVPVKIGGSGKVKRTCISAGHLSPDGLTERKRAKRRAASVTSNVGGRGSDAKPQEGKAANGKGRYRLADACRLQGLSDEWTEAFIRDCPFTAEGKLKAVANGVSLYMGKAVAKAVKEAVAS